MSPILLAINSKGPVRAECRMGKGDRLVWIIQPEDFPQFIAHVNEFGGPTWWDITEI